MAFLIVCDEKGKIFEIKELLMTGSSNGVPRVPHKEELIPLSFGSDFFALPGRTALGFDPGTNRFVEITEYAGKRVFPVAAFMAPGYLQLLSVSYKRDNSLKPLPLYSYTAAGFKDGRFYCAGIRIDSDTRQDPAGMDEKAILRGSRQLKRKYPENRLVAHLMDNCVAKYCCPAARNLALGRWEAPVPTSPYCNARCFGCISCQEPESGIPSSQNRISFVPTPKEITQFTLPHLEGGKRRVISFGQGCEGEPLLVGDVLIESVKELRKRTERGIINLNTNASRPEVIKELAEAGLDSLRVSLNSCREEFYNRYYSPQGYRFKDVLESIGIARKQGLWISLNYFMFPGFTDTEEEYAPLLDIVREHRIDMIQTRNLNFDPQVYSDFLGITGNTSKPFGLLEWISRINRDAPWIKLGYYNPAEEDMAESRG